MKTTNRIKRFIDIFLSISLIIILIPIMIIVILLIIVMEGRPLFYISYRYVSDNRSIKIYKFRTMANDALSDKYDLNNKYMKNGFLDIPLSDPVYTKIGRILERLQLVEILQLFNVLAGDMSIVGNRPLPENNINLLKQYKGYSSRFDSPSGITGISQVVGKLFLTTESRLTLESAYSDVYNNPNGNILICDIYIIYYTFLYITTGVPLKYERAMKIIECAGRSSSTC
jgi:lipopolysaccharide/colanic/teichoic acid biosynthesis glycosyltransferase